LLRATHEGATPTKEDEDTDEHLFHIIMHPLYFNIFEKLRIDDDNNDISMIDLVPCWIADCELAGLWM